jgi:hypothetical protein
MDQSDTVVRKRSIPSEGEFHALLIAGLARASARIGRGALADQMDMSGRGLDKVFAGSHPSAKRVFDVLFACDDVLDDVADRYGKRLVDKAAVCDVDDLSLLLARVNLKIQEAQHPDSPGGENITHGEYLGAEQLMRELHAATGRWIEKCKSIREPSLRSVA